MVYKNNLKIAKQQYYNNKINKSSNKIKQTWNIINERLGRCRENKTNIVLKYDTKSISDFSEISELFALHFSTVAECKVSEHFAQNISLPCTTSTNLEYEFSIEPVTVQEIADIINQLENKKSSGIDDLSNIVLKNISDNIVLPLVYLINQSFSQGVFPDIFKIAQVIPLFKKGCPEDIDNYRQISLLSSISKIIEKAFYIRLFNYLEKNNILSSSQHGFRSGKSIETACYHLLDYIYSAMDSGDYVISMFFDLSKAFDTIQSDILIKKLCKLGIKHTPLEWIKSYINERRLTVKYNSTTSTIHNVRLGVPQGSVLGPLLFMLYVNDLPNYIDGHVTMYADDTTISISAGNVHEVQMKAEQVVTELSAWCERNRLILNENKTVIMNFHIRKSLPPDFNIMNIKISQETKFLSNFLDPTLSWDIHIDNICKKLNKAYFGILQMKDILSETDLLNIYYTLAYPHMSLNILSWGCGRDKGRIFILQKRIMRLIFNLNFRETCRYIFKQKNILTVPCIFIFKCLMYTKQNINVFSQVSDTHAYGTRHGALLRIPTHTTSKYRHSPKYNCINIYNMLPKHLREINCPKLFKIGIKKFLLEKSFYSVDEFLSG